MTSLHDVAKATTREAVGDSATLSLVDVANITKSSAKFVTLMDVAKHDLHSSSRLNGTLQEEAQDKSYEDRVKGRANSQSALDDVKVERQEDDSQPAAQGQKEEFRAEDMVHVKVPCADQPKHDAGALDSQEDDSYSSFEEESPKNDHSKAQEPMENDPCGRKETYDPPERTTPSKSKESKEFFRAVYLGNKSKIQGMLDTDVVDVNIADQHGWTGLHWAASQNHSEILTFLLQKGARVNAIDRIAGWTALHVGVVRESVSCVTILLSSGADPRIRDNYSDTVVECLQAARSKTKRKMLQLLHESRRNKS